MNKALMILVLIGISGCATMMGANNPENLSKVALGDSSSKVVTEFGRPDIVINSEDGTTHWVYQLTGSQSDQEVRVDFKNRIVTDVKTFDGRSPANEGDVVTGSVRPGNCTNVWSKQWSYSSRCD